MDTATLARKAREFADALEAASKPAAVPPTVSRYDIPALLSTIDALRAENTRLREALESIVRRCHGPHTAAADIARTALENPRP